MRLALLVALSLAGSLGLVPPAVAPAPYWEETWLVGHIRCSLGLYPFETYDFCAELTDPGSAQNQHDVGFGAGLSAAVVHLSWTPSQPAGGEFLIVTWIDPDEVWPASADGSSPVRRAWDFQGGEEFVANPGTARFDVRANANPTFLDSTGAGLLVIDQTYLLCVAFFYHGAEDQAGFDEACADE